MASDKTLALNAADKIAKFMTNHYAKKYIEMEISDGNWPASKKEVSNIFDKDLGKALDLKGTKAYFDEFNSTLKKRLAVLISQNNGNLELCDIVEEKSKYSNVEKLLNGYQDIEILNKSFFRGPYPEKFEITIKNYDVNIKNTYADYSKPRRDYPLKSGTFTGFELGW